EAPATSAGRVIQRGEWLITFADDGAMAVTNANHPELLIIVRGRVATLYQSLEGGGLRVLQTAELSEGAGAARRCRSSRPGQTFHCWDPVRELPLRSGQAPGHRRCWAPGLPRP
ncbi:hypothetical protein, partial [Paracraurococcus lichenis]